VKIGRVPPADVVLPHKSVSREHCIIGLANDELFVTDLNSTNGTFIDGERIRRATVLPVGSIVQVGLVSLRHAVRPASGQGDQSDPQRGRVAAMR
jgi:pSer/pThr/pTyr-binding forkhead associated (FHA) protein